MDHQVLFGVGTTELEVQLAEKIVDHVPCAEQVVLCGSGSEATYHALRLARAVTGRDKIIKFQGHYHGFHDYVLRNTTSEPQMIGKRDPASTGMLDAAIDATLVARYNDAESVRALFREHGSDIAAVIVEPIAHNSPSILPIDGFLADLRTICDEQGALLIFDEVITGFRHHLGGFQAICGVTPDLGTFGKALANGYPLAAVAGKASLLEQYNTTDTGRVAFAGTFNGGAVPAAAALATIVTLEQEPVHDHVFALGDLIATGSVVRKRPGGARRRLGLWLAVCDAVHGGPPGQATTTWFATIGPSSPTGRSLFGAGSWRCRRTSGGTTSRTATRPTSSERSMSRATRCGPCSTARRRRVPD